MACGPVVKVCIYASKTYNIGVHSRIYELICFKLDLMIDVTRHYILILF